MNKTKECNIEEDQELTINEIRTIIVSFLDEDNYFTLPISREGDPYWIEKLDFLSILSYNGILKFKFSKDSEEFEYEANDFYDENNSKMKISEVVQLMTNREEKNSKDILDLTKYDKSNNSEIDLNEELEQEYFDNLISDIIEELDTEEQIDISAVLNEEDKQDETWADRMTILMQLHEQNRISIEFCPEHLIFTFRIGERHCNIHPEHNDKSIKDELDEEDILLSNEIIH